MNGAHLHLLVNHVPILGVIFGLGLGVYALVRHQDDVVRAALGVLVLAAIGAFAANWTGEGAEHVLERAVPSVSEDAIHEHAEFADKASIAAYVLGGLALVTLGLSWGKALRRPLVYATLVGALVVSGLLAYTANLGGGIRHTEISTVSDSAPPPGNSDSERGG